MADPIVYSKFKSSYTPENRQKRSTSATQQMRRILKTEVDRTLWECKISNATKAKWKSRTPAEKQKIRLQISKGRKIFQQKMSNSNYKKEHIRKILGSGKITDTKPERQLTAILEVCKFTYKHPFQVEDKVYDFYIPSLNLLIEVDGNYWHGKGLTRKQMIPMQLKHRKNDIFKTKLAKQNGFNILRIWEDAVNMNSVSERISNYV